MMSIAVKLDVEALLQLDNVLASVRALPDLKLELLYADGSVYTLDMKFRIRAGTPAAALWDERIFNSVRIARRGRAIEFEGGIDFCADALRVDAELELRGLTRADLASPA
jgi:hypothetical protein